MTIPEQVRRRRAESFRMPKMYDGRHDPLDSTAGSSRTVQITVLNANTTFVGDHTVTLKALNAIGCRKQRARGGGWLIEGRATDDLCAWLDRYGYTVQATL